MGDPLNIRITFSAGPVFGDNGVFDNVTLVGAPAPDHPEHPEHPDHPEHPHVHDAGSTLTLLGMALGGLGFMRRR